VPFWTLNPGSGIGKKSRFLSKFSGLTILKFSLTDQETFLTLDPGWKKSDPGKTARIRKKPLIKYGTDAGKLHDALLNSFAQRQSRKSTQSQRQPLSRSHLSFIFDLDPTH
jgi:hypothetical protein